MSKLEAMHQPGQDHFEITESSSHNDEIDLFELFSSLWERKWLITTITGVVTLAGVAYLVAVSPTYQASAHIRPPTLSDLSQISETGVLEIGTQAAFQRSIYQLESLDSRQQVFEQTQHSFLENWEDAQKTPQQVFIEDFNENISVALPTTNKNDLSSKDYLVLSFEHWDAEYSRDVVNLLAAQVNKDAVEILVDELKLSVSNQISLLKDRIDQAVQLQERLNKDAILQLTESDNLKKLELEDQVRTLRIRAKMLRLDKMAKVGEALKIAETLGVDEPTSLYQLSLQGIPQESTMAVNTEITQQAPPYYLRGAKILSAELSALEGRTSDDHDDPDIRDLEQQIALLDNNREIEILKAREDNSAFVEDIGEMRTELAKLEGFAALKFDEINLLKLDQPAILPSSPIKPRKALILALCLMAGGFLGVLVALIAGAIQKHEELAN